MKQKFWINEKNIQKLSFSKKFFEGFLSSFVKISDLNLFNFGEEVQIQEMTTLTQGLELSEFWLSFRISSFYPDSHWVRKLFIRKKVTEFL